MRLNQYLAHAGITSRRKADDLIKTGSIAINGAIIKEVGTQVKPGDIVTYRGKTVHLEKKIYLLLNKPAGVITSVSDEEGRTTVIDLIKLPHRIRLYPVGRLDATTTGVLLITNDGDLALRLSHPRFTIPKMYHVTSQTGLTPAIMKQLTEGVQVDGKRIAVDRVAEIPRRPNECIIEIHSGKNRIVRRLFEQLGKRVTKLDRIKYANLSYKGLARGEWRFLSSREIKKLTTNIEQRRKNLSKSCAPYHRF
ncbi:MAG: rRNA pseudouridine synthase [Candidatus Babeliaceae bacterium]|nr:rRNA pseudouridine synthase [Candidatus Babeliaceae bacterium]